MVGNILDYCVCIVIVIIPVTLTLNPFIIYALNKQDTDANTVCIDNSNNVAAAEMEHCGSHNSYFHYIDLFSDLSRNMTSPSPTPPPSSSDLFEDNADTELQDDAGSNAETDDLQDEDTTDTNQTSSSPTLTPTPTPPPSSSDLFGDNADTELQDDAGSNAEVNLQDETAAVTALQENNDNNTNSQLTNDT